RVGFHFGGLASNPNLHKNGRVRLTLPKTTDSGQMEEGEMWVPGTSNIFNLLISIQNQILITKPFYNYLVFARESSMYKQHSSLLYNENTFLKSLKTMVYIMNKSPKNFENLVVGHFRNRVRDILMASKAYTEGVQEEDESGENETSTIEFRNDVASCIKLLLTAFMITSWIPAHSGGDKNC
ncbi:ubiquitin-conjugating enzyme/RWD-like protein, partial [Tanacetum coccineum]